MSNNALSEFEMQMKDFVADRDTALLSMDKEQLFAFGIKWGVDWRYLSQGEESFWVSVHMARTGAKSLPMAARVESKAWLTERGLRSIDDGDLP